MVIDGFSGLLSTLRDVAARTTFAPAGEHYPGVQAELPAGYVRDCMPFIARAAGRAFGRIRRLRLIDASFSIVTMAPERLSVAQRLPHVDAHEPGRVALVHYLSDDPAGTSFYRHRSTGWETVGVDRARDYQRRLAGEVAREGAVQPSYLCGATDLFEKTATIDARPDRALLYRSYALHSGAIPPEASLSPSPLLGRLTVTAFLTME